MTVADAIVKMISFYKGNAHDINHLLKVYGFAKTIGEMEKLDANTQRTLEYGAVLHDIACPLCREKYGSAIAKRQEEEGIPLTRLFFDGTDVDPLIVDRVVFLVSHHHTLVGVSGMDYQILLEADYLVNAEESHYSPDNIRNFRDAVFKTASGTNLLNEIFLK